MARKLKAGYIVGVIQFKSEMKIKYIITSKPLQSWNAFLDPITTLPLTRPAGTEDKTKLQYYLNMHLLT